MKLTQQLAQRLREIHFGDNWIATSLKDKLQDVTWQQAVCRVHAFHSMATLVFHLNYYVDAVRKVLRGGPLDAKDEFSFDHPPIDSAEAWENLLHKTWTDAEDLACLIEQLPESKLWETFVDEKYGNYHRNLLGILEHSHYHLGQIALIKQMVLLEDEEPS